MTKRLRGTWHAWHFRFALGSVIKSLCGSFCSACLHPLTRRYKHWHSSKNSNVHSLIKLLIGIYAQ
ncbi:DUF3265 domain-containing protein [Vibrio parahaemolyticus]|nr:DUF3265 domain-containing protein [Vibrio parahaemolyticus]EJE8775286.1 DUF3265 domain-containing protein [Vibrio parahaemolyticus]